MVNRKIDSTNNDTTTDTEGHAIRILPDHKGRSVDDADDDDDDTEGHAKASRF